METIHSTTRAGFQASNSSFKATDNRVDLENILRNEVESIAPISSLTNNNPEILDPAIINAAGGALV